MTRLPTLTTLTGTHMNRNCSVISIQKVQQNTTKLKICIWIKQVWKSEILVTKILALAILTTKILTPAILATKILTLAILTTKIMTSVILTRNGLMRSGMVMIGLTTNGSTKILMKIILAGPRAPTVGVKRTRARARQ